MDKKNTDNRSQISKIKFEIAKGLDKESSMR